MNKKQFQLTKINLKSYVGNFYYIILLGIILVNCLSIGVHIFNGDSSLYASISKNIASSNDFFHLKTINNCNWIDKPHFSFWIWSIFIKIFGSTTLAFKLPVLISLLMLLGYVYLFSSEYYSKEIAIIASIILGSSTHIYLSTNDVRIDIFLVSFMMASIYHIQRFIVYSKPIHFIFSCFFAGLAVDTKGIFILIPIFVSIASQLVFSRNLKLLVKPIWVLSFVLIFIFTIPELYSLKVQFRDNQENFILGSKAKSYLQFFLWDSQFGRFNSNLGQLAENGNIFFYLHTLLWSFGPWTFLLTLVYKIKSNPLREYYSIGAFTILFFILSFSKTQLSHHSVILLPFLSILLSSVLSRFEYSKLNNLIIKLHYFILACLPFFLLYISHLMLGGFCLQTCLWLLSLFTVLFLIHRIQSENKLIVYTAIMSIFIGLYLNTIFYPSVLQYQSGKNTADFLSKIHYKKEVYDFYSNVSLLHYYTNLEIRSTEEKNLNLINKGDTMLIYTTNYGLNFILQSKLNYKILNSFNDYRTTVLTPQFINFKSRGLELRPNKHYLILVTG